MPMGLEGLHGEAVLAAAYALLLLVGALAVERMARRTHGPAEAYSLAGFTYHPHLDAWECPTGQHLPVVEVDHAARRARYRAAASACNRCPLKSRCTDSDTGREVTRTLDPWLETEIGRFHRGMSLVRNHLDGDVMVLGLLLLIIVWTADRRVRSLHPMTIS
jgi:hypothetical protein